MPPKGKRNAKRQQDQPVGGVRKSSRLSDKRSSSANAAAGQTEERLDVPDDQLREPRSAAAAQTDEHRDVPEDPRGKGASYLASRVSFNSSLSFPCPRTAGLPARVEEWTRDDVYEWLGRVGNRFFGNIDYYPRATFFTEEVNGMYGLKT